MLELEKNVWLKDRYQILGYIHKGGMGAVYRAHDRLDNRAVAIKQSFFADRADLREQFIREATLLRRLDHPVLPKVHDYFSEGAGQFLVMDCIEGSDLESLLATRGAPFEWRQVVGWADRILGALDYIHTRRPPVIHRDIKPANLKLTPQGELLLLDFGLAKNATTPTQPGKSLHAGTPGFAPPEQMKGTGTDMRCDIYSLGATLYNLLTDAAPAEAKMRAEMMAVPMPDPLRPAHLANPQIPLPLSVVLARAMAVDRERRYSTAAEMREALLQAQRSIEEALLEEQRHKEEAARRLAEQQRLAEEGRLRALAEAAEAERRRREETARRQREEAERKQKEKAERKQEAERKQREARQREQAEQRRREQEARDQNTPPPTPVPRDKSRHLAALGGAVLLACLLGYWVWQASQAGDGQKQIAGAPASAPAGTPTVALPSSPAVGDQPVEVLRYAQKFESRDNFRLRFAPQRDGYLYLFGLDEKDKAITLLTNRHAYDTKAQANRLTAGTEFVFPKGTPLSLGAGKPSAPVTLIFSPVELNAPAFLNAAELRDLTPAEQRALNELKRQAQARSPKTAPSAEGATMTASPAGDQPLVFEIVLRKQVKGS